VSVWLRIGGYPATEIAAHTPPTFETWADGGCGSATFALALSPRAQHPALAVDSLVEIMCGTLPIWSGLLSEPDRTTWECHAYGLHAAKYLALDGSGVPTRGASTAINAAIARGWRVSNPQPISGAVAGDATGNPVTVGQLLDDYAEQLGQRWGVDGQGRLYMRPDPTFATWLATPDSAAYGTTSDDRAATLYGVYLDSTSGVNAVASAGAGQPEEAVDLTDRGAMSLAQAQAILAGMLTRDKGQIAWTNGVNLSREQITTMGGSPASLITVQAGQLVTSHGLSYATQGMALNTVIGKTRYTVGEDSIYIEPVNTAPRAAVDVWAS